MPQNASARWPDCAYFITVRCASADRPDVNYIVPWSLAQIGNGSAIRPLIGALGDPNPSIRVLAIYALVDHKATEALPRLRQLLSDNEKSNFGKLESVADAAQAAIAKLR